MKVVILAGGFGTRLMEETEARPKPMIEIGGKPILWHIMKIYEAQGFTEFIICLGYKGYMIKEYFMNYFLHNSDITIDIKKNKVDVLQSNSESFKVTLVDTGLNTKTAGRLKRIKEYIGNERFMLTYGDGLADINLNKLIKQHKKNNKIATVTSIRPVGRFGSLDIDEKNNVQRFVEKPKGDGYWINGGFFVLEPNVFDFLPRNSDDLMWEEEAMEKLALKGGLSAYKHEGFWKCMDALRDKMELEKLWESNHAQWKIW